MAERTYPLVAIVRRTVMDNIRLNVKATTLKAARDKARSFLKQFPEETDVDGINYAYIENRENLESEVVDLGPDKRVIKE